MSFPMEGYTLALDFPVKKSIFPFLNTLDDIVLKHGGRIYLAKDARMKKQFFHQTYPEIKKFINLKSQFNKSNKFQSMQSERLGI